jgi:glycosyltransferase involved in cell wall biosynthesis
MRILFITPRFGTIHRGVEIATYKLAEALASQDHEVSILSGPHRTDIPGVAMIQRPILNRENLPMISGRFQLTPTGFEALSLLWSARDLKGTFDVILPQGGLALTYWARKRWPEAKVIYTGQGGVAKREIALCDGFIAMTAEDARLSPIPAMVIPHQVDLNQFYPITFPPEPIILCVAALEPSKEHHLLFSAFNLLSNAELVCIGSGRLESELKAKANPRIRITSAHPRSMPAIYRCAKVFTLPSTTEVLGIVFLEAMATGLPIVAPDRPRARAIIGPHGFYTNVNDPQAYAKSLQLALDHGPHPKFREQVKDHGWAKAAQAYTDFIASLN